MTNKPTWEEEFDLNYPSQKGVSGGLYITMYSTDDMKQFISTKLAEQKQQLIEKIEKQEMPQYQDDGAEHAHAGYVKALEDVISIIKQD